MTVTRLRNGRMAVLVSASLSVFATPALATDGYFLNGTGAKAKGAGGVAIALPQDALTIAANPASATELDHRIDIGADLFVPDRSAEISGNGAGANGRYSGNGTNPFVLPEIGYVRPLSRSAAVGIAIYGNGGMNTDYRRNPFAAFGASGSAGVNLTQIFVTPTLALRIAKVHSIGISPVAVIQGFRARGLQPFAAASSDPANFTNRGTSWAVGGGVRVGWLGRLTDRLKVGAVYQSKIKAGNFDRYAGLFAEGGSFDVPASWGAGLSYRLTSRLDVAIDVKRIEYSDVQSVGNSLAPLFAGVPFGADGGPGFGWRDITAYKAGVVYAASPRLTLRAGYDRSGQPIPQSQTFLNILAPGVVRDHFAAGATWNTAAGFEITGHVTHAPKNRVAERGSIPNAYGGGEADISLAQTVLGVSFGFKL